MKINRGVIFLQELAKWGKEDYLGLSFYNLFRLKSNEELNEELNYLYTLYKGTDSYWKESSIDCWFSIWHKSVRQSDYFTNCYQKITVPLLSQKQISELKFLRYKCNEKEFSKTAGKKEDQLFNDTYSRYLELRRIENCEHVEDNIGGYLDSILWGLVHVDSQNRLMDLFIKTFKMSSAKIGKVS